MIVTVVIPALNAADTIGEALDSVRQQSNPDWEAIVVDDGSTDATSDVVRTIAAMDPRVRLRQQSQSGQSAARNTGIAAAQGELLLFLDADDWIASSYLEKAVAVLSAQPELGAVHCLSARVAADGTVVTEEYEPPIGDIFPTLARRVAFPIHACVVRKTLVDEVGRFDRSVENCPDWDLWQRVARTGAAFGAIREVLAFYRMRPNSESLNPYRMVDNALRILRRGHGPDPRVPRPHPDYVNGWHEDVTSQEFYTLSWSAGVLLGRSLDARPLLRAVEGDRYPDLYPEAVAECIFESATLPGCQPPHAWAALWPRIETQIQLFLAALEVQAGAPGLASRAHARLVQLVASHSSPAPVETLRFNETAAGGHPVDQ